MDFHARILPFIVLLVTTRNILAQQQPANNGASPGQQPGLANLLLTLLTNNGTQSGQTTQQQAAITNLLTTLLSNNEASLALLQTPEIAANLVGLFDYLNTTGNVTGVFNSLSTDSQVSSLTTTLVTLLFESLSLTVLTNNRVSDACQTDMIIFIEELLAGNPWALRMFDAMGKPGSDLADFQAKFVGSYEECIAVHAISYTNDSVGKQRERGSFDGKYCSVSFPIAGILESISVSTDSTGSILLGLCLPSSCGNTDAQIFASLVEQVIFNRTVPSVPKAVCHDKHKEIKTDAIIAICVLAILGCLIILGTCYDALTVPGVKNDSENGGILAQKTLTNDINSSTGKKENQTDTCINNGVKETKCQHNEQKSANVESEKSLTERILLSFSVYTNGARILTTNQGGQFASLNGIRFMGISWIVLGHTLLYSASYLENILGYGLKKIDEWTSMVVLYSDVSVDTFFVMSGLLVSYLTLNQMKKVGGPRKINWAMFYFHRYWRITPSLMLVLIVGTIILPYVSYGPFWNSENFPYMAECRQNWWANLLYINNLYDAKDQMCMSWTWYIACDMQFYWISPLIILPLFYNAVVGIILCVLLMLSNIIVVGKLTYDDNYSAQATTFLYGKESGLLVSYLTLNQMKKVGGPRKINWAMFYFHRYWRITPSLMLVLIVGTIILPYVSYGPFWNSENFPYMAECRQNWWANLLYINNLYDAKDQMCMSWTWYIACDMQFYWISPLIILPLFYNAVVGIILCVLLMLSNIIVVGKLTYDDNYSAQATTFLYGKESGMDQAFFTRHIYFASYSRCGPYMIGILLGYFLYRRNCKCNIPKVLNLIGWLISIALTSLVAYSRFEDDGNHIFSRMESAIFASLHRIGLSIAVSWIIFACVTGNGGLVNRMLSWRAFIPLARLSLCAYLVNPIVVFLFYTSRMLPIHLTDYELTYLFLGNLVMTYGLAFILSLLIEAPMIGLEKVILAKWRK